MKLGKNTLWWLQLLSKNDFYFTIFVLVLPSEAVSHMCFFGTAFD